MRGMGIWKLVLVLTAAAELLLIRPCLADQPKCRGTKKAYKGKCLYPDEIEKLKEKARTREKRERKRAAKKERKEEKEDVGIKIDDSIFRRDAAPRTTKPKKEKKAEKVSAPPSVAGDDLQARRKRIQEIYTWGRSESPGDRKKLVALIQGNYEPYEKATAIRALGTKRIPGLVDPLKKLARTSDLAVKSEAAIVLYQWGEKEFAGPLLEELLAQGVALRRAFFLGINDGKYKYDSDAGSFFRKALRAPQVHVKLDAALGLLHLGHKKKALAAFEEALGNQEKEYVRLTAVSYLASARDIPEARALLEKAQRDSSPRVAKRAKQILGTTVPHE